MTSSNSQFPESQISQDPSDLNQADQLLKQFDCTQSENHSQSTAVYPALRQALQIVAQHSDFQILGICADSVADGVTALHDYAAALGYTVDALPDSFQSVQDAAYIKFNPKAQLLYADHYAGPHRGVLVSCQSAYSDGLNEMYGHLPLNLFRDSPKA